MERSDRDLWAAVVAAQRELVRCSAEFSQLATDKPGILSAALRERGWPRTAALHYLRELGDASVTVQVLPELVELATYDAMALSARQAISHGNPSPSQLRQLVLARLDGADGLDFRRLAELLEHLHADELLQELVARAARSDDFDTREVADDYRR